MGDRLPIALAVAAKVTGTTTQQFMKMMEQGQIIATDFLPKFAGGLRGVANEGDGVNKALGTANREMGRLVLLGKLPCQIWHKQVLMKVLLICLVQ